MIRNRHHPVKSHRVSDVSTPSSRNCDATIARRCASSPFNIHTLDTFPFNCNTSTYIHNNMMTHLLKGSIDGPACRNKSGLRRNEEVGEIVDEVVTNQGVGG